MRERTVLQVGMMPRPAAGGHKRPGASKLRGLFTATPSRVAAAVAGRLFSSVNCQPELVPRAARHPMSQNAVSSRAGGVEGRL